MTNNEKPATNKDNNVPAHELPEELQGVVEPEVEPPGLSDMPRAPSLITQVLRLTAALVAIAGLIYLSGVYQFLFLSRTPETITQPPIEQIVEGEILTVPVRVVVLAAPDAEGGSDRDEQDVVRVVRNASHIWQQAGIALSLHSLDRIELSADEARAVRADPVSFIAELPRQERGVLYAFLTRDLGGLGGVAFGRLGTIALADHTATFDFQVFAHEVGHALGLDHTTRSRTLMHPTAQGVTLSEEEARTARAFARMLLEDDS